jgi:hypothetical protein
MEVCYWALLFMPLVILHHLLNVFVQLANKRGFTKKKKRVFVASGTYLPSRCLAMARGFQELRGDIQTDRETKASFCFFKIRKTG